MILLTELLVRLFVRDYQSTKDPQVRARYGRMAGVVGILCNLLLGGGKVLAGGVFSSIAVLADGINNLSDATSSVVTLVGFKMSSRPADKEHPFGHARMEYVSGLVVAILILMVGCNLVQSSFGKILHPEDTPFRWLSVGILAVSILVKTWMMVFNRSIGRRIDSTALMATAADSRNDVIATSAVLAAALISKASGLRLDGWMGMAIALFILYSGVMLIRDTLSPLLGEAPNPELVHEVMKRLRTYDGVLGIHDLVVHDYGPGRCVASVQVEGDAREDVMRSPDRCDVIERDFQAMGLHLVVHMDPIVMDDPALNELRKQVVKVVTSLGEGITLHDFRVVKGYSHTNLIFDVVAPSSCRFSEEELKRVIQEKVRELDPSYYTVIGVDRNYTELV